VNGALAIHGGRQHERYMHVRRLDVEGHQAVGWSVPSNNFLYMHQVPVLEEGTVALKGSGLGRTPNSMTR
jgi:hypothetical protein